MTGPQIDPCGQRFSRLLVISRSHKILNSRGKGPWYFNCVCDCGNTVCITLGGVRRGVVHSCGCYKKQRNREVHLKHGMCGTKIRGAWAAMLRRCEKPHNKHYHNYGGRGITVSKDWHDFLNFYRDMGDRPPGMWLERLDNDKGYSKENCVWATPIQNLNNRRPRKSPTPKPKPVYISRHKPTISPTYTYKSRRTTNAS